MAATPVPCTDAFLAKLDSAGKLSWATYLGGSLNDQANAVAIDASGNIYVAGLTLSEDFPSVAAFQSTLGGYADGFVSKISPDGSRVIYSSFIGGVGYDIAHAITVDSAGDAYVAGELQGGGINPSPGSFGPNCQTNATNAFLLKVAPSGNQLVFAGCLGPQQGSAAATAVALDNRGTIYLGGDTNNNSFPTTPGAFQGLANGAFIDFLTKISADGSGLVYSAIFDGSSFGVGSIAVDQSGDAFLTGDAGSSTALVTGPAMQPCPGPAFLLEMNPQGSGLNYFSFETASDSVALAAGSLFEAYGSLRRMADLDTPGTSYLASSCVLNGASFASHLAYGQPGISPGEIVTLKGTGLGPATAPSEPAIKNGTIQSSLDGVQVLFDGVAAPLLYAQNQQINVVAPYALAGKTQTSIQIQYAGQTTSPVTIPVSAISAAAFEDFTTGVPLVFNQDFSRNTPGNPASPGSSIVLYITGGGQTSPASADGQIWETQGELQAEVSAQLQSPPPNLVTIPAVVSYAGPVGGETSGLQQLNIQIPALPPGFASAGEDFLTVTVGSQLVQAQVALK